MVTIIIYKDIMNLLVGEVLQCNRDQRGGPILCYCKERSRRTFTVKNIKTVLTLLTEGGTIDCMVTGARRHSTDLWLTPKWLLANSPYEKIF